MAEAGQLICVYAGKASAVKKVMPYGNGVIGRANIDLRDQSPSKATLLKLIGNTFVLNMIEALAEGHTLAEKSGLGSDCLHQYIEAMFPTPYPPYSIRMMNGDYHKRDEVCTQGWGGGSQVHCMLTMFLASLCSGSCSERSGARIGFSKSFGNEAESCRSSIRSP